MAKRPAHTWCFQDIILFVLVLSLAGTVIPVGFIVTRMAIYETTYRDICPDYIAYTSAYVVDDLGRPVDSAAVIMKDNSNVNTIYKTFTEHDGRFTLFNDFYSFTLYETPITFELRVYTDCSADTILYKFRKYRVCHFEKTEGPDTIVIPYACRPQSDRFALLDVY